MIAADWNTVVTWDGEHLLAGPYLTFHVGFFGMVWVVATIRGRR